MIWIIAYIVASVLGGVAVARLTYIQGWGDATYEDGINHKGEPDDDWHKRRRRARYIASVFCATLNPVVVLIVAYYGRRLFRAGVESGNPEKHGRWY